MASKEKSPFKYWPYVTLREWWEQVKVTFFVWVILSAIIIAFVATATIGVKSTETYWSLLRKPAWGVIGFAVFTWFVRGEEIRLALPQTFKGWFLLNLGVALVVLASLVLPTWAMIPLYIGATTCFFTVLDELAATGKSNYERLSDHGNGA